MGRLLRIAEQVDIPVVIVHTTNIEALDEIANARWRGQKVFVETCPQYLVLDDSVYYNEDWLQAAKYVCSPPIRKSLTVRRCGAPIAVARCRRSPPTTAASLPSRSWWCC